MRLQRDPRQTDRQKVADQLPTETEEGELGGVLAGCREKS